MVSVFILAYYFYYLDRLIIFVYFICRIHHRRNGPNVKEAAIQKNGQEAKQARNRSQAEAQGAEVQAQEVGGIAFSSVLLIYLLAARMVDDCTSTSILMVTN